jgi:hypothetical protein
MWITIKYCLKSISYKVYSGTQNTIVRDSKYDSAGTQNTIVRDSKYEGSRVLSTGQKRWIDGYPEQGVGAKSKKNPKWARKMAQKRELQPKKRESKYDSVPNKRDGITTV